MGSNSLSGAIPDRFQLIANLKQVDLSYNTLTGIVPASLAALQLSYMYQPSYPGRWAITI